jgi:hypothetical protein
METSTLTEIRLDVDEQFDEKRYAFWLLRLSRLVALDPVPSARDERAKLIRHAIYSTYLDCRAAGVEKKARRIIMRRRTAWLAPAA